MRVNEKTSKTEGKISPMLGLYVNSLTSFSATRLKDEGEAEIE